MGGLPQQLCDDISAKTGQAIQKIEVYFEEDINELHYIANLGGDKNLTESLTFYTQTKR